MTVLKCGFLVNKNMTEMYVNCGSRNAHGSISKVELISLAFKCHEGYCSFSYNSSILLDALNGSK